MHFWASAVTAFGREREFCCSLGRDWKALASEALPGEGNQKSPLLAFAELSSQSIFSPKFFCLITYIR